jgi:hypothetical protein
METSIIKMLITKHRKEKTLESWKVLENMIEDKSYCRDCDESIFYPNSLIRLGKDGNIKYDISKPCSRSFKELDGVRYYLSSCPSCLDEKFNEYSSMNKSRVFNVMNRITRYAYNIPDDVANAFTKTTAVTLENLMKKYGENNGKLRWVKYRNLQAVTNTFEYKKEKYGWNKSDFDKFNRSRAITEENLINRHGESEGKLIFDEYCKKQVTNGKTPEWFIEKHGEIKGNQIYKLMSINKAKGTSSPGCVSKVSQEFFDRLDHYFNNLFNTRYSKKNKESIFYIDEIKKTYSVDYYIEELNLAIEFNGDYYHANPNKYHADFDFSELSKNRKITAKDLWEKDEKKYHLLEKYHGIKTIVVWESDYYKNKSNNKFYKDIARLCIEKK